MIGINGQPWFNLEQYVDLIKLESLHTEIVRGLTLSNNIFYSVGYEYSRGDAALDLYNLSFKDVRFAEKQLEQNSEDTQFYETLTKKQKQMYLKIAYGAYYPWSTCLLLVNSDWMDKCNPVGKKPTEEAKKLFPNVLEFVYGLPIFEGIGRITIFGVDPGQHITCHRDLDPGKYAYNDELAMFSPIGNKLFYMYDPDTKIKHYVSSKAYAFHDYDFHGVDALPCFNYNFRVDGVYSKEFKELIKFGR